MGFTKQTRGRSAQGGQLTLLEESGKAQGWEVGEVEAG